MTNKDFKVGADPEFVGITGENPERAASLVNNSRSKERVSDGGGTGVCAVIHKGGFGADGSGRPFELRPDPSFDPIEVVSNIQDILKRAAMTERSLAAMTWKAGAMPCGWPIGGHIHLGTKINGSHAIGAESGSCLLDNYVGAICALVEGPEGAERRRGSGYGKAGACREQDHGFEYRTPASWLTSPHVAAGMLCLSKTVIYEAINNPDARFSNIGAAPYINAGDVKTLRGKFSRIWEDITRMKLYQDYKQFIDVLYFLVDKKLTWEPSIGMKQAWGVDDPEISMPHRLHLSAIWSRYNQEVCHG